jgi:hypothetical protein
MGCDGQNRDKSGTRERESGVTRDKRPGRKMEEAKSTLKEMTPMGARGVERIVRLSCVQLSNDPRGIEDI